MQDIKLFGLYVGKEEKYKNTNKEFLSSYKKTKVLKKVFVNSEGLVSDNQSDRKHHGGEHKAICAFCKDEYTYFENMHDLTLQECSFGENLTLLDIKDKDICLADRFIFGDTILEVTQPREPCFKISSILAIKTITSDVIKACKTGFYLRVIKEGYVDKNSSLKLISRKYEDLNIEFINKIFLDPKDNQENIKIIISCPELGPAYRKSLKKRLVE